MNPTPIEDDDAGISERLDRLTTTLDEVHETLKQENVKRDQRIRTNRRALRAAIAVAVLAVIVAVGALKAEHDSRQSTTEARKASCQQFNLQQSQAIASDIAQSHDFADALTAGRAELKSVADAFNARHDKLIRDGHPKRDCSPEGIEKYLQQRPG